MERVDVCWVEVTFRDGTLAFPVRMCDVGRLHRVIATRIARRVSIRARDVVRVNAQGAEAAGCGVSPLTRLLGAWLRGAPAPGDLHLCVEVARVARAVTVSVTMPAPVDASPPHGSAVADEDARLRHCIWVTTSGPCGTLTSWRDVATLVRQYHGPSTVDVTTVCDDDDADAQLDVCTHADVETALEALAKRLEARQRCRGRRHRRRRSSSAAERVNVAVRSTQNTLRFVAWIMDHPPFSTAARRRDSERKKKEHAHSVATR